MKTPIWLLLTSIAGLTTAPSMSWAYTPNDCNLLLVGGVFDKHDVFGSLFQHRVFLNRFCSAHYHSLQDAENDSLNATIPIYEVMVGFGFSENSSTFKTDYDTLCSQQDAFLTSDQRSSEKIRVANGNLTKEFRKCVEGKQFSAWLEPTDTKQFQIIVQYRPTSKIPYDVVDTLKYDPAIGHCDRPPPTIGSGGLTINCSRKDDKVAFQVALNTQEGTAQLIFPAKQEVPPVSERPCGGSVPLWRCDNGGLLSTFKTVCTDTAWGQHGSWGPPTQINFCKAGGFSARRTFYVCSKGGIGTSPHFCDYVGGGF
jgi:hypothetical protein